MIRIIEIVFQSLLLINILPCYLLLFDGIVAAFQLDINAGLLKV